MACQDCVLILKRVSDKKGYRTQREDTVWCVFLDDFHDAHYGRDLAARVIEECQITLFHCTEVIAC
jgi:hypothetical protein